MKFAKNNSPNYRGRFAPSPTGPLHLGSLIAATASYLEAKTQGGAWLLRIEDLDPPREQRGGADDIIRTLAHFGFEWDEDVVYQSRRQPLYAAALASLQADGWAFSCRCTRKTLKLTSINGVYPGTCRNKSNMPSPHTIRVKVDQQTIGFHDALQGDYQQQLNTEVGDFIIRRADQLFAYQLAVVVDDAEQDISHIVRGSDLLSCTPRQIYLQQLLGLPEPHYAHIPVLVNARGNKLSKQTQAPPLDLQHAGFCLHQALGYLGQNPPTSLQHASIHTIWRWALAHWRNNNIPQLRSLPEHTVNV